MLKKFTCIHVHTHVGILGPAHPIHLEFMPAALVRLLDPSLIQGLVHLWRTNSKRRQKKLEWLTGGQWPCAGLPNAFYCGEAMMEQSSTDSVKAVKGVSAYPKKRESFKRFFDSQKPSASQLRFQGQSDLNPPISLRSRPSRPCRWNLRPPESLPPCRPLRSFSQFWAL